MDGTSEDIITSIHGPAAIITLNRPNKGNSITPSMGIAIKNFLERIRNDINVRVVILTGNGKFFCTGMDLGSSNQNDLQKELEKGRGGSSTIELFDTLFRFPKPIICKVNGPVMGGGVGLFFMTDIRIVNKDAHFSFPEVKRGIVPALISAYIVPQLGLHKSKQFMLTGERVTAQELYRLGAISQLASNDEEMEKITDKYIEELMSSAPKAMEEIKGVTQYTNCHTHDENVKEVQKVFSRTVHSEEGIYGISCFVQKQKPDWIEFHSKKSKL